MLLILRKGCTHLQRGSLKRTHPADEGKSPGPEVGEGKKEGQRGERGYHLCCEDFHPELCSAPSLKIDFRREVSPWRFPLEWSLFWEDGFLEREHGTRGSSAGAPDRLSQTKGRGERYFKGGEGAQRKGTRSGPRFQTPPSLKVPLGGKGCSWRRD